MVNNIDINQVILTLGLKIVLDLINRDVYFLYHNKEVYVLDLEKMKNLNQIEPRWHEEIPSR